MSTLVGLECGDSVSKPLVSLLSELLNFKLPRCLGSVKIRTVYALVLTRDSDYLGFFFFFISPPQKKNCDRMHFPFGGLELSELCNQ